MIENKAFFSTTEVAKIMHISSVAVLKKIKTGQLEAQKIGRNYIIAREDLESILGSSLSQKQRKEIDDVIKKTVGQYENALRRLGREE